jgi:hypothetical protein
LSEGKAGDPTSQRKRHGQRYHSTVGTARGPGDSGRYLMMIFPLLSQNQKRDTLG